MNTWMRWMSLMVVAACVTVNVYAEGTGEERPAPRVDRTPLGVVAEPQAEEAQTEETAPAKDAPKRSAEERLDELEHLVRSLFRHVDPYNMRDEMRLERRIRDLERQLERVEQELRRLQADRRF